MRVKSEKGENMTGIRCSILAVALIMATALCASGSVLQIGGPGAISTTDGAYGSQGLLSGGETATATFGYVVNPTATGADLILTVTNTSPAVTGSEAHSRADAPVISDVFFSIPDAITGVQFVSAGGVQAANSGWNFQFERNGTPSKGFGFLKNVFDVGLEGGPQSGSPDPVISSINDPNINDGPGDPFASPYNFVFSLTFAGNQAPAGFNDGWFVNSQILGSPDYIAAAKFMSGANGGGGTVTNGNVVPEPATIGLFLTSLGLLAVRRRKATSDI